MEKEFIGLLGVVVGFVLNLVYGAWGKRNQRKQEQYYLAVVVTMQLDRFFDEAVFLCGDNGTPDQEGYYISTIPYPKFELPTKDVDWRSLPQDLMRDILWLPECIRSAQELIASASEYAASPPYFEEYFETRQYEFAKLALSVNKMSMRLRKVANLPMRKISDEYYDPITGLIKIVSKVDKVRDERHLNRSILLKEKRAT
ncbi:MULTISPECIES: hypothetical protein [Shewanella]|nr:MULTISPECIES: hypothetical protein [Shewanella]ADT94299.1 hypothetical protein Sbal678_2142 [Shewanella baltica OS678]MCU8010903.1 hypothetical protein [Shewanella sp. SM74]RBP80974.1 hypothetical protein DET47_104269 [Shewanella putrefaciens]